MVVQVLPLVLCRLSAPASFLKTKGMTARSTGDSKVLVCLCVLAL